MFFTVILASQLFLATTFAEEQKQIQVTTKMNFPEIIPAGETVDFSIDVTYKGPFSWVKNLEPNFDIVPSRANYDIEIQYDESISDYTIWKNHIHKLDGTIHVQEDTSFEAIFLSVSFEGIVRSDEAVVSVDPDSTVSLIVGESIKNTGKIFDKSNDFEIIPWDDLEYELRDDVAIIKNNIPGISILESGTEYYVIQKAEFKASKFGDKDTRVNATVGYAIQKGDVMIRPPIGDNVTEAEHRAFALQTQKQNEEFAQQSTIENSFDFVVDIENPFYIKFPFVLDESGKYTRQFYTKTHIFEGPESYGMGGLTVVDKFSKAVNEDSQCKNDNLMRFIKHDYSTVVCVEVPTARKLIDRGWGL